MSPRYRRGSCAFSSMGRVVEVPVVRVERKEESREEERYVVRRRRISLFDGEKG